MRRSAVRQQTQPGDGHTQDRTSLRPEHGFGSSSIRVPARRRIPGKISLRHGSRAGTSDISSATLNRADTRKRSRSVTTPPTRGKLLPLCGSVYWAAAIHSSGQVRVIHDRAVPRPQTPHDRSSPRSRREFNDFRRCSERMLACLAPSYLRSLFPSAHSPKATPNA